jgi:hypothetical protein
MRTSGCAESDKAQGQIGNVAEEGEISIEKKQPGSFALRSTPYHAKLGRESEGMVIEKK